MTNLPEDIAVDPLPGIYRSRLCLAGLGDTPQPVILVGEEADGWWFQLPATWPATDWVGDTRWFSKKGASFTPEEELPVVPVTERYPEVAPFVESMYAELAANIRKGDQDGWRTMSLRQAWAEISWHAAKLAVSIKNFEQNDPDAEVKIREFSADVANGCMMLVDILNQQPARGNLGATPTNGDAA